MAIRARIQTTDDGTPTLVHPVFGDSYHSLRGAVGESTHVFIENGFNHSTVPNPSVLEVGFGSGLNALLTLQEAEKSARRVDYTALEAYPIDAETVGGLSYGDHSRFVALHRVEWGRWQEITPFFRLKKVEADLLSTSFDAIFTEYRMRYGQDQTSLSCLIPDTIFEEYRSAENTNTRESACGHETRPGALFNIIYFDAFCADTQPELWSAGFFCRLYDLTAPGGFLVTYSAKGDVKRALRQAGYDVKRLPGALGKRHMLRATKT